MIRDTAYYSARIAARYPDLPAKEIHKLCVTLMRRIYSNSVYNNEIRITSNAHGLSLKIYNHYNSAADYNAKMQGKFYRRWCRRRFAVKQKPSP